MQIELECIITSILFTISQIPLSVSLVHVTCNPVKPGYSIKIVFNMKLFSRKASHLFCAPNSLQIEDIRLNLYPGPLV